MSMIRLVADPQPEWYVYLSLAVLTPLAFFLTFRVIINYKVIELGNGQITIKYKIRKKLRQYPLSRVIYWKESIVKTGKNSTFKELEIRFDDQFRLNLGLREYSNYPKVQAYLTKKLAGKKQDG